MPGTADVGSNIRELTSINNTPGRHRPRNQIIAIAESQARKAKGQPERSEKFGKPSGGKNGPPTKQHAPENARFPSYTPKRRWTA